MMDVLDLTALERCLGTLKRAHVRLLATGPAAKDHDMFRAACVKEFELIVEIVAKLLRRVLRVLREYVTSTHELAEMTYKDTFRTAARHGMFSRDEVDAWFLHRDNRNTAAHEYGQNFAEKIVVNLPQFIRDADAALAMLRKHA